ncbi:MAG: hypothetical protein VX741_09910, partial [Pseudomonadota bacterium]|nr:hypothetical protein [Pseudomonadota bacterium]
MGSECLPLADFVDKVGRDGISGIAIESDFKIPSMLEICSTETHTKELTSKDWLRLGGQATLYTVSALNGSRI